LIRIYLDTNVIIARYKPQDPLFSVSNDLFERKDLVFTVSPLTLVELHSVISRLKSQLIFSNEIKDVDSRTLVSFIIRDCNLQFLARNFLFSYKVEKSRARIPLEYYLSIIFADKIQLRTLDLIHIAYAYMIKDFIDVFTTGDEEILEKSNVIERLLGITVKHPKEI